jgi:hypothetical protein
MVWVKLNERYSNEFLTTHNGYVFYRKHNTLGKKENVVDIDLNIFEAANLLQQGVLKLVEKDDELLKKVDEDIQEKNEKGGIKITKDLLVEEKVEDIVEEKVEELVETIKEDTPKYKINNKLNIKNN